MQNVVLGIVAWLALNGCVFVALVFLARRSRRDPVLGSADRGRSFRSLLGSPDGPPDGAAAASVALRGS